MKFQALLKLISCSLIVITLTGCGDDINSKFTAYAWRDIYNLKATENVVYFFPSGKFRFYEARGQSTETMWVDMRGFYKLDGDTITLEIKENPEGVEHTALVGTHSKPFEEGTSIKATFELIGDRIKISSRRLNMTLKPVRPLEEQDEYMLDWNF